jgi:hypothetical protein
MLTSWTQLVQAQVTISGSNGADGAAYANLGAAFTAISAADQTGKTISVTLNQAAIVETASAVLTNKGWTSLTITPGIAGVTVSGAVDGALIKLDGAKNVTIDGRIGGAGSTKDLTISNTSISTAATQTILMINDAKSNTIKHAIVKGTNSATVSGTISITTGLVDGNDNNTIDNCDICDGPTMPVCPIFLGGSSATIINDGTIITNCNIYNYMNTGASTVAAGIYIPSFCNSTTVENNRFFWTTPMVPTAASTFYGMIVRGDLSSVKNNVVGYADRNGTGIAQIGSPTVGVKFIGIQTNGGGSFEGISTVANNTVAGVEINSNQGGDVNAGVVVCYYTPALAGSYINYTANTAKDVKLTYNGTPATSVYWNLVGMLSMGSNCVLKDNSISNLTVVGATLTNKCYVRGISVGGGSATVLYTTEISHNTISNLVSGDINSTGVNNGYGIQCASQSNVTIERNNIFNIASLNSLATAATYGIITTQGLATSPGLTLIKNNMVNIGNGISCGSAIYGIMQAAYASTAAHASYFNNTVYIGGSVTSGTLTGLTMAFNRSSINGAAGFVDLKNNIFVNVRTGGTGNNHYSIRLANSADYTASYLNCNNNIYQVGSGVNNKLGAVGNGLSPLVYTDYASFADWKTTCTGFDDKSSLNNPQFVDPTNLTAPNLHIRTDVGTPVKAAGADVSDYVGEDIDGDARTAGAFDIGADANPAFTIPVFEFAGFTIPVDGKYEIANKLDFFTNYTMPVSVTGTPSIPITLNTGGTVQANYVAGSGSTQLKFSYTVATGQVDADGITIGSAIALNGGTIKSEGLVDANLTLPAKTTTGILVDGNALATVVAVKQPVDKIYPSGANLDFTLSFSNFVTVIPGTYVDATNTGVPQIDLTIGDKTVAAAYVSGSGTKDLLFRYATVAGQVDNDGIVVANVINLNGATIQDPALININASIPALTTTGITVNGVVPTILSVVPSANGIYGLGSAMFCTVTTSEPIFVTGSPQIKVTFSDSFTTGAITYVSGSGTSTLLFRGSIGSPNQDLDGVDLTTPMVQNSASVKSASGNTLDFNFVVPNTSGIFADYNTTSTATTSMVAPADGKYTIGQNLDFVVNYDGPVDVVGTPSLTIYLSGSLKYTQANYLSGTGTNALTFRYTVENGDVDADGITFISESSQTTVHPNAGSIKTAGSQFIAKVVFTAPVMTGITVDAPSAVKNLNADTFNVYAMGNMLYVKGDITTNTTISIYDICGKIVAQQLLSAGSENTLNVPSLKGVYIVAINNNGQKSVNKVIFK